MTTSYNGAPAFEDLRNTRPFSVDLPHGTLKFPQGIIDDDAAEALFTYVVQQWNLRVEQLPIGPATKYGWWGANYRTNRNNPSELSCHSSGTAIDIWAVEHPNRVDTLTPGEKDTIARIGHETGHEVRFGIPGLICPICGAAAGWTARASADNMHAELRRYLPAAWAAAAANLPGRTPLPPPTTTAPPTPGGFLMALTDAEQKRILGFVDDLDAAAHVYKQDNGGELFGALLNDTQRSFNILRSIDGRTLRNQTALTDIRLALADAGGVTAEQVVQRVARIVADADK